MKRPPRRKILLLALGGTIACIKTHIGLVPKLKAADLVSAVSLPAGIRIESRDFLKRTIVFPKDWIALGKEIFSRLGRYDGFVITLGTDTLAYAAAALSLMLKNLSAPVVFTGAMNQICAAGSDAKKNLCDAIRVAAHPKSAGVLVVFHGKIIRGDHAVKIRSDRADAFESVNFPPLGTLTYSSVRWAYSPKKPKEKPELNTALETHVSLLKLTPVADANEILRYKGQRGILVEGYGDGNIPTCLVAPLKKFMNAGGIIVLASQCPFGETAHKYEGGAALIRNGALSSSAMTSEAALAKLMLVLGRNSGRSAIRKAWNEA